jgi:hypothetical protein
MTKQLMPHWKLSQLVRAAAAQRARDEIVFSSILPGKAVVTDDGCEGVGRASWDAKFIFALRRPHEIPAELHAEIARLKDSYDLGVATD